jgi:Winged helix DNA-binding domain
VVRVFTVAERRGRLARRHFLSADRCHEPLSGITGALVGLHATDPATPYLSLWARSPGFTTADLDRELYERRSLVKHLAMRRTLWVVRADDLAMIQPGASDRVADNERRRLAADAEKAGIAADGQLWLDHACSAVLRYLAEHGAASATALRKALPELAGSYDYAPGKRWGGETPLAPRLLTVLSVRGDIVRGLNDGAWTVSRPRWTSVADWLGNIPEVMPADKARAELVRIWLRAFGPGTIADVKWWFGTTLAVARQALRDVDAVEVDVAGSPGFVLPDDLDPELEVEPWCALLPALDVTTMGWFDRDWYLGDHRGQLFDRSGNAGPTAWWNGRVVGGWIQDADGRVRLQLLEDPGRDGRNALSRRAAELTDWLGGVRISPRFPSTLSKAAATPIRR